MTKSRVKAVLWRLFFAGSAAAALATWHWQSRWGATAAEQRRSLPGDQLVPQPNLQATRAVGIAAPPSAVWPWLVQLGQDKGGFYSYDWLERAFGLPVVNADVVEPEWQRLEVGDPVTLGERVALRVAVIEPGQALVLEGDPAGTTRRMEFEFSWSFVLEPEGPTGSRLVVRERYMWTKWRVGAFIKTVSWVSFVMSRAMLLGLRSRAERSWQTEVDQAAEAAVRRAEESAA
ncbi:MAG: hypothetical protein LBO75_00265 [Bifidobacteriaceae bacterium]|jgi:hypothetical protein|nr:hypothetical protein [Bifidobacteriaceae bacterium]